MAKKRVFWKKSSFSTQSPLQIARISVLWGFEMFQSIWWLRASLYHGIQPLFCDYCPRNLIRMTKHALNSANSAKIEPKNMKNL